MLHYRSLYPYLAIHFKLYCANKGAQSSVSSGKSSSKMLEWQTMAINFLFYLWSSTSASFGWLLTLRPLPVPIGKQQRSHIDPVVLSSAILTQMVLARGMLQKFIIYRILKTIQVFPCPFPRQEQLCNSKSIRLWVDSRVDLSFQANLSHLSPCSLWLSMTMGWVSELCGPLGDIWG